MATKIQEQMQVEEQTNLSKQEQVSAEPRQRLDWKLITVAGLLMGISWAAFYASGTTLSFLAGIIPILAGFYIGRRVAYRAILHSALTSLIGLAAAAATLAAIYYSGMAVARGPNSEPLAPMYAFLQGALGALIVFPFSIYGAFISQRGKQQRQEQQEILRRRGGRLEHPGRVRDIDDLRGLPLPKFTAYVVRLFRKHGFQLDDYIFDKDSHVDVYMTHEGQRWLLRCTVADKVKPGLVQELAQKMRNEQIRKGVVLTSTEFTEQARRWADNRRELVVVDGETLIQMNES
ncbi:MAG: restriction endonuclease [Herpetosiphonaceae bacterium]|nr:MAG: restriction endonuclease [Herpetosiphonaceae bacterium]